MTERELTELGKRQLADYDACRPGTVFESGAEFLSLDEAYRLQLEVVRLRRERGEQVAGYKIGCVSEVVQRQLGIKHPVFGHVFAGETYQDGVVLDNSRFDNLHIEGEFALRLARDFDPAANRLEEFVEAVFPVIELHNYALRAPEPSAVELVANNAVHAGIVIPSDLRPSSEFLARPITVRQNGEELGTAGVDVLATLRQLADRLAAYGIALKKGDIVLTGSPLPLYVAAPGDEFEIEAEGIGNVRMLVARATALGVNST
jgi:2-keto-4-pentenoate hydratase